MIARTALLSAALSGVLLAGFGSSPAHGDVFDDLQFRIGFNVGRPRPAAMQRVWVEPVYENRCERVWVEPVFENRCERVWHEAVYEERCERVLIPDRFETRRETTRDYHGRTYTREVQVLVEPAHYVDRPTRVLVRAGGWEDVPQRVCVSEGHWTEINRQVVVREGYWAEQPVICDDGGRTRIDVNVGGSDRGGHDRDDWRGRGDEHIGRDHDRYARDRERDDHDDRRPREDRGGRR